MPDVQAADSSSATFVPSDSQRTVDAIPPSERENWRLKGTPFPKLTEPSEGESADTPAAEPVDQAVSTETQAPPASEPGTGAKPRGAKARSHELDADIQELHAKLAERAALRRQLAEEERQPAPAQAKPQAQPQAAAAPFPDFASWLTQHPTASYEDYIDARAEDRVERKWAEQEARVQAERQATQHRETAASRQTAHLERLKAARDADPQFLEKLRPELSSPTYTPLDLLPAGTTPTWANVIAQEVMQSDKGPQIMQLLSKDDAAWQALTRLSDYRSIVRQVGILEASLSTNGKASRQISGAPPVSAVQIGRSQSEPADEAKAALKTGDFRRYREIMNARDIAKAK